MGIENKIAEIKKQMHDLEVERTLDPKPSAFYMQQRDHLITKHTSLLKEKKRLSHFQNYEKEITDIQKIKDVLLNIDSYDCFEEDLFKNLVKRIEVYDKTIVIIFSDVLRFNE